MSLTIRQLRAAGRDGMMPPVTTTARRLIKERYEVLGSLGAGGEGYVVKRSTANTTG